LTRIYLDTYRMLKTYEEASRTKKDKGYILLPVCFLIIKY